MKGWTLRLQENSIMSYELERQWSNSGWHTKGQALG